MRRSRMLWAVRIFWALSLYIVQSCLEPAYGGESLKKPNPPAGSWASAHSAPLPDQQRQDAIYELRQRHLLFPIDDIAPEAIKGSFYETRAGVLHEASDIKAPRNTPIRAVEDGTVAKLFLSKPGGITIYEFDPSAKYVYYYAHLERYARGLLEGQKVKRGQIIGYVGTSGNAPKNSPHLHFSISVLGQDRRWWAAAPLDPYEVFER